jgi:hypothetical protein
LKLSNSSIINLSCPHLSGPPEISYPIYLPNGDRLRKFYNTIAFITFENGGIGHFKTPQKKPQFWWEHTCNPKP